VVKGRECQYGNATYYLEMGPDLTRDRGCGTFGRRVPIPHYAKDFLA